MSRQTKSNFFRKYVTAVLLGGLLALGVFAGGLSLLDLAGKLPPPPISNRVSFDQKLHFIRETPIDAPTVLAVGSSQTLNQFNGEMLRDLYGAGVRPLNGSAWGFGVDKLGFLIDFYLASIKSIEQVITITSLPDFAECTVGDSFIFDVEDAADYAFRGASAYPYYFEYFDPIGLLHTAFLREYERLSLKHIDEFGSVAKRPELRPQIAPYLYEIDDACFATLRDVALNLAARNIPFSVVLAPLKPAYVDEFDPEGSLRDRFFGGVEKALAGTGARLINANEEMAFSDDEFWDSTHLYWDAASRLSYEVALRVGPDGRGGPARMEKSAAHPPTTAPQTSRN
jgi:hypothetical protein